MIGGGEPTMHERSLCAQRDTMRALKDNGLLTHPMGNWAWRIAQANFLIFLPALVVCVYYTRSPYERR